MLTPASASIFSNFNGIVDVEKPVALQSFIPPVTVPAIPLSFPLPPPPAPAPEAADHKDEGETRCIW